MSALAAPPGSRTSFTSLRQMDASALNIGSPRKGPADGAPVILLHGSPYDIHGYVDVAPLFAARGIRLLVPSFSRLWEAPRFSSPADAVRDGQQAALAPGHRFVPGYAEDRRGRGRRIDWGARTAVIVAAVWPERVQGAGLGERLPDRQCRRESTPLGHTAERGSWSQYCFATQRGVDGSREKRTT